MFGQSSGKVLIVERGLKLNEEEMRSAFKMSETSWRAIVQLIEKYKLTSQANEAAACGDNNALAMAAAVGAGDALSELLIDLEQRRVTAIKSE